MGSRFEAEDGQQHHERAERAGNDGAGRVEFEVDEERAADQHEQGDVGIDQPAQQLLAQREALTMLDPRAGRGAESPAWCRRGG
jgi:hypothetical protein